MKPRRINQTMIAKELGIAQRTVSKALRGEKGVSDELRQKVLDYADKMSYRGDRLMRSLIDGTSHLVGVVLPDISNNMFLGQLFMGIETVLKKSNYKMIFTSWETKAKNDEADITTLLQYNVDGLIIFPRFPPLEDDPYFEKLLKAGDQVVFVNEPSFISGCGSVYSDDKNGIEQVLSHLQRKGHEHIAFVGPLEEQDKIQKSVFFRRHDSYTQNRKNKGLSTYYIPTERLDYSTVETDELKAFLKAHPEVTAFACFNDYQALSIINGAKELGIKVPDQLAVAGYGDVFSQWENYKTPLTTVSQDSYKIGSLAAEMCINMIKSRSKGEVIAVDPKLLPRQST